jgi:hypothetical protein
MEQLKVTNKLWDLLQLIVVQLCALEEELDVNNFYLHIMTIMIEPVIYHKIVHYLFFLDIHHIQFVHYAFNLYVNDAIL